MATASKTGMSAGPEIARPEGLVISSGDIRPEDLDRRTLEIGRELFDRIGRGVALATRLVGRPVHGVTLDDPVVRVQLFRFIDALPALKDAESVRRHLAEYLDRGGRRASPGGWIWPSGWRPRARPGRSGWPRRRGPPPG